MDAATIHWIEGSKERGESVRPRLKTINSFIPLYKYLYEAVASALSHKERTTNVVSTQWNS